MKKVMRVVAVLVVLGVLCLSPPLPVLADTEATFYPDPDPETSSVDGYAQRQEGDAGVTWGSLIGSNGNASGSSTDGIDNSIYCGGDTDRYRRNTRSQYNFNTSTLPDNAIITSAVLYLWKSLIGGTWNPNPIYNIYAGYTESSTDVGISAYENSDSSAEFSTGVATNSFNDGAYTVFTLNSAGRSYISVDDNTVFSMKSNYDVTGTPPSWEAGYVSFSLRIKSAETAGTSNDPKLVVTYILGPAVTTNAVTLVEDTLATLNGNCTSISDSYIAERGFAWGTSSLGNPGDVAPESSSYTYSWTETGAFSTGVFDYDASGLLSGTTYYVRACAQNSDGDWGYGGEVSFTTLTLTLWFQPVTMIGSGSVPDRSGCGNTGTIHWGANPGGIVVTVGGIDPYEEFVAPGGPSDETPATVLPPPTGFSVTEVEGVDCSGLPLYDSVHSAAASLDWTDQTTYTVLMLILSIGLGFAGLLSIGSGWGFTVGFGGTMAAFGGTGVPGWGITILCVLFAVFVGYVWRYT